jgi:hypothetical protein
MPHLSENMIKLVSIAYLGDHSKNSEFACQDDVVTKINYKM